MVRTSAVCVITCACTGFDRAKRYIYFVFTAGNIHTMNTNHNLLLTATVRVSHKYARGCYGLPYSGKIWRALNLANRSPERFGEF